MVDRVLSLAQSKQRRSEQQMSAFELGLADCLRVGASALQFQTARFGRIWVPREAIHPTSEVRTLRGLGTLRVRLWWAKQKHLIERRK
jgi:hypothetical protein